MRTKFRQFSVKDFSAKNVQLSLTFFWIFRQSNGIFQPSESQQSILESLPPAKSDILEQLISEVHVDPILWNEASSEYKEKETHKKTSALGK